MRGIEGGREIESETYELKRQEPEYRSFEKLDGEDRSQERDREKVSKKEMCVRENESKRSKITDISGKHSLSEREREKGGGGRERERV